MYAREPRKDARKDSRSEALSFRALSCTREHTLFGTQSSVWIRYFGTDEILLAKCSANRMESVSVEEVVRADADTQQPEHQTEEAQQDASKEEETKEEPQDEDDTSVLMIREVKVRVFGSVQGVFFRVTAVDKAKQIGGIFGQCCNMVDGSVFVVAQSEHEEKLRQFVAWLREGPPGAKVKSIREEWKFIKKIKYPDFEKLSGRYADKSELSVEPTAPPAQA